MHRPLTKSESALAEIGLMFLPGIPAYFWLWPRVADTTWDRSANALVYIYFIFGILFIGLRRWNWNEIGVNRNGIGFSLACGAVLIVARMFALACTNISYAWQLTTLERLLGETFFYVALVGVGEELIFRGVLWRALEEWHGPRWAILITTLGFGLWHVSGRGLLGIAVGVFYGIFFAAIRWRTGGIVGLIVAHGLMDLSTVAIVPDYILNHALLTEARVANSWFALLSEITFVGLLIYLWKAPLNKQIRGTA